MIEAVQAGFGVFMGGYYAALVPETKALTSYVSRGLAKAIVWAPGRMIDQAEEMLASWQRNNTDPAPTKPPDMPVMICAMAKDAMPSGRDYTRQVADRTLTIIPSDPKNRLFGLRAIASDIRAQIVVFAHDAVTARALAAQFLLYIDQANKRRFYFTHTFAGQTTEWPAQIETQDTPAISVPVDAKNMTILAIDLTLKATIPMYDAPAAGQPNDGQGVPGTLDPAGYPLTTRIDIVGRENGGIGGGDAILREETIQ